jgi:tetratricopeptide (TPR) repeat protein
MNLRRLFAGIIFLGLLWTSCAVVASADDASKKKDRAQSYLIEARRLAADYKIDKAADKARDALKDYPNLAEAHVYLGLEHLRTSDLKNAQAEFEQALGMDPYLASAHCWLGYVLYQEGQLENAADHWTLATRLDSTSPHAFAGVALSQFKHGQEEQAVRTYEKALIYDRRFADSKFLESEKGPKWSGQLLQDFEALLAKVPRPSYP